jgi:hypothetical protein
VAPTQSGLAKRHPKTLNLRWALDVTFKIPPAHRTRGQEHGGGPPPLISYVNAPINIHQTAPQVRRLGFRISRLRSRAAEALTSTRYPVTRCTVPLLIELGMRLRQFGALNGARTA